MDNNNIKEHAIARANEILHSYGYHIGNAVDYEEVVEMLTDVLYEMYNNE